MIGRLLIIEGFKEELKMFFCEPWPQDKIIFNKSKIESKGFDSVERDEKHSSCYIFKKMGQSDRTWNAKKLLMMGYASKQQEMDYCVDIVVCIDLTNSMQNYIEEVKESALSFPVKFVEAMEQNGHDIGQLRVKVIGFRDFGSDSEPIVDSGEFFVLPDENKEFECFVRDLQVNTGGDIPESGLEAIALAMKSDWTTEGNRQRHMILVFTDAPAHPLGFGSESANYPDGLPVDLAELGRWWNEGIPNGAYNPRCGRLVVFAPDAYPWIDMQTWNRYWHAPSKPEMYIDDIDIEEVIDVLFM